MGAKYGQHFLINKHAAERIVDSMKLTPDQSVLEIGPGKGALTALMLKARSIGVVEIDDEMVGLLKNRFGPTSNVRIFHADILKFDFSELGTGPFKVVGNLPYNLTSPILRRLSEWNLWTEAFVMVQKEVADRLCARHGTPEYGALSVGMNLTCKPEFVFELSETSFNPPPKVKSAVVKLIRREVPLTSDVDRTQRVIQAAFQQRRKTILNSLSHGLGLEKTVVEKALAEVGVESTTRGERIPVETFVRLSEVLPQTELHS